jgi:hypothetical protein
VSQNAGMGEMYSPGFPAQDRAGTILTICANALVPEKTLAL